MFTKRLFSVWMMLGMFGLATVANAATAWQDDFSGTFEDQVTNWADETQTVGFNAHIQYSSTASWANITRTAASTWGKVLSPNQTVDVDTYPRVEIVVTGISSDTSWKIGIQEQENSYLSWDLGASESTTGTFSYDLTTEHSWTGTHTFSVQIVVEGAGGKYIEIDSVRIFDGGSGTPTDTPTVTPTPDGSGEIDYWQDHFTGTFEDQVTDWADETQTTGFNAHIQYSSTASWANVTRTAASTWGKVLSPNQTVDVDTYPRVEIVVTGISSDTSWKIGIQEQENSYLSWDLGASESTTGTFSYDLTTEHSWTGTHTFSVQIVIEGAGGKYIEIDSVRIYGTGASGTPTYTATYTPTPTPSPVYSATYTATQTITPTLTLTPDPGASSTFTPTVTQTITPTEIVGDYDLWLDHFSGGIAGDQPAGWYDTTDGISPPAEIAYSATMSYADVTVTGTGGWGNVTSDARDVDLNYYTTLEVVISDIQGGTVRVGIFHPAPYTFWDCVSGPSISSPGTYTFDIPSVTSESGVQNYAVQLTVEGAQWASTTVDSVRIFGTTPPPTSTPTQTPDLVNTATTTPTPTVTPAGTTVIWEDPFEGTSGEQPIRWDDDTQGGTFGTEVSYLATPSLAEILRTATSTWGKIESEVITCDTSTYDHLSVTIDAVSGGANWKVAIQEIGGSGTYLELNLSNNSTGTADFNYASLMSWTGSKTFKIILVVEGAASESVDIDYVGIYANMIIPTATPTVTLTPTPDILELWSEHFTGGTVGEQPTEWLDETDETAENTFNLEIAYSSTDSFAALTRNADSTWGKIWSPLISGDVDTYSFVEVTISSVSPGASWGLFIQEEGGSDYRLKSDSNETGTFSLDCSGLSGWTGDKDFRVVITTAGNSGEYVLVDQVRVFGYDYHYTPTPTFTATPSPTNTPWVAEEEFKAYPNPARNSVTFGFIAEGPVKATIDIYRTTGERVTRIVEEKVGTSGEVLEIAWNAVNVAPGIYFCRMVVENSQGVKVINEVKKVAIIK